MQVGPEKLGIFRSLKVRKAREQSGLNSTVLYLYRSLFLLSRLLTSNKLKVQKSEQVNCKLVDDLRGLAPGRAKEMLIIK